MHVFLPVEDSEAELRAELAHAGARLENSEPGGLLRADFAGGTPPPLPYARQVWWEARPLAGESIRAWSDHMLQAVLDRLPDDQPWRLQITPHYGFGPRPKHRLGARAWHSLTRHKQKGGSAHAQHPANREQAGERNAGQNRATLIRQVFLEALRQHRRHRLKQLIELPLPFTAADSLVQLLLTAPDRGFLAINPAPAPHQQRHLLSPFPNGEITPAQDKQAPSRAFAKLVEAELRLGRAIQAGETCVDLGAAPGSWTYVAVMRGAKVTAVDRAPLRPDLQRRVRWERGDAFTWKPAGTVDWLLCDVICAPERSAALLRLWLQQRWCRNFVVTLKSGDAVTPGFFQELARSLAGLCRELRLTRLCANKKEVCVYGSAAI